ncbi:hypothetical protein [Nitratifractor sp.]
MRKWTVWMTALVAIVAFTGCGGGAGGNDLSDSTGLDKEANLSIYSPSGAVVENDRFSMALKFDGGIDGVTKLEHFDFTLDDERCTLSNIQYSKNVIDTFPSQLVVSGTVSPSGCQPSGGYVLKYDETITINGHSKTVSKEFRGSLGNGAQGGEDGGNDGAPSETSPNRIDVDPASFTVRSTKEAHEIHVQVFQNGRPVEGMKISAMVNIRYGSLDNYEAVTNAGGIATFVYVSPVDHLPENDANVTFYSKDDPSIDGHSTIHFSPQLDTEVTIDKFYLTPSSITVATAGQTFDITGVVTDAQNHGLTGIEIRPEALNPEYGTISPADHAQTQAGGRATFHYTAPSNIDGLTEQTLRFSVENNGKVITRALQIKFNSGVKKGHFDISVDVPHSLHVDGKGTMVVRIHQLGDESALVSDDQVKSIDVQTLFPDIVRFEDNQESAQFSGSAVQGVPLWAQTRSGTAVLAIHAVIDNAGEEVTLDKNVSVVVLSGPVASISLFYARAEEDKERNLIKSVYTAHAVDKYDNPVGEGVTLTPAVINGVKFVHVSDLLGTLSNNGGDTVFKSDGSGDNYSNAIDPNEDLLIVTPNSQRFDMSYLGNWQIDEVLNATQLRLHEPYKGEDVDKLSYIIGNSHRALPRDGGNGTDVVNVDITSTTGSFRTDGNGTVQFTLTFDPLLAGHTVTTGIYAYDSQTGKRVGISKIEMLRWNKYTSNVVKVKNDGASHEIDLFLGILAPSGSGEHLVDVDIVPQAILSSSSQCGVDLGSATNDFHTDYNGRIHVTIYTLATDSSVKECAITWNKLDSGIYLEY